jgi:sec-independent protein translocase protein TatB
MIDIPFSKLAIIGAAALVFIGPEKLPTVARMAGNLFGRAQRYLNEIKAEVSREMELDELRKMHRDIRDAAENAQQTFARGASETEKEMRAAWRGDDLAADEMMQASMFDDLQSQTQIKSRNFRKKKLARTSALPSWYKNRHGHRSHVISGAARMARHRPSATARRSPSFFS